MTVILITKDEVKHLEENGFRFGDAIHSTKTRYKKYYATESQRVLRCLAEYRQTKSNN